MEFDVLRNYKGLAKLSEDIGADPFEGDQVGTSLFMTGAMGPKITQKNERGG